MPTIADLTAVDETVADGDLLALHNISKGTNLKDQGLTITKLRSDAFLARANTWSGLQTFTGGINLGENNLTVYDEGTWTPTDGSGAGLSFSSVAGRFTRIGRLVFAEFAVTFPATTSSAGNALSGLPFAPASFISTSSGGGFLMGTNAGLSFVTLLVSSAPAIRLMDSSFTAYPNADLSGKIVRGTVIYTV